MGAPSQAVRDFMAKYKVAKDEIWEVHGSKWVVKHKALERVAVEVGVTWDRPAMLECKSSDGIVALCVFGKLNDREEWSIGETSSKNCKNSYYYAMAEKRAKDRVILKLLSAHGALYSESEVDEFTEPARRENPHVTRPADLVPATEYDDNGQPVDNIPLPDPSSMQKLRVADQRPIFEALQKEIHATGSVPALQSWADTNKDRLGCLKPDWQEFLRGVYAEQLKALRDQDNQDNVRMMANG